MDPVPFLRSQGSEAIRFFVRRDLLGQSNEDIRSLWNLKEPQRRIHKQREDGSWKYPGSRPGDTFGEDYEQLETYRQIGELIEKYGFDRRHKAIRNAARFLFSRQTAEGDFRGIYGPGQYTPNYTAAIVELLIKAGYQKDRRIEKSLCWLMDMRQDDGGWALPSSTRRIRFLDAASAPRPLQPERDKPFSHLMTGIVLRAFAAHSEYCSLDEIHYTGNLLLSRFFRRDKYPGRSSADFWERVSFPFWFTDVISALDTLSYLGFTREDERIRKCAGPPRRPPAGRRDLRS